MFVIICLQSKNIYLSLTQLYIDWFFFTTKLLFSYHNYNYVLLFDNFFLFVSIAYKWNLKQEENLHIYLFPLFDY